MSFDQSFLDEDAWLRQSEQFFHAANVLVPGFATPRPSRPLTEEELGQRVACLKATLLLLAVSVENALKAVKISRREVKIQNGHVLKASLGGGSSGHDLLKLAEEVGLNPSAGESTLLGRLTVIATWAGKYQQPLSEAKYNSATSANPRSVGYPSDIELVRGLLGKCKELVRVAVTSRA